MTLPRRRALCTRSAGTSSGQQGAKPDDREATTTIRFQSTWAMGRPDIYPDPIHRTAPSLKGCARRRGHCQVEIDAFRACRRGASPERQRLVIFKPDQFAHVAPYLMCTAIGPMCSPPTDRARGGGPHGFREWLGKPVELNIHTLPRSRRAARRCER